jgi:hypothetical protein
MGVVQTPAQPSLTVAERQVPTKPEDEAKIRYAMLSVYHHSLGREFEVAGAPTVMLPQQVEPMSLADALEALAPWPDRVRDAAWRIVRAYPPPRRPTLQDAERYPHALADALTRLQPDAFVGVAAADTRADAFDLLHRLDVSRASSRFGAHLFAMALVAVAQGDEDRVDGQLDDVIALLRSRRASNAEEAQAFDTAAQLALGMDVMEFLESLHTGAKDSALAREQIRKLEDEIGLGLYDFVEEFADAIAFATFWQAPADTALVYPASSVICQNTSTLTTTATVTTLIKGDFATLCRSMDPQCWMLASDVMTATYYVADRFTLERAQRPPAGTPLTEPMLLAESCAISWGENGNSSTFDQVLWIDKFHAHENEGRISVEFSLCRSIGSRVLWDERAGGLLVDEGFIKARQLTDGHWRVTSRKVINFSDRTPNTAPLGGMDFGEMLNYLAPAAMIWWVESEMYSTSADVYTSAEKVEKALEQKGRSDG